MNGKPCDISDFKIEDSKICIYQIKRNRKKQNREQKVYIINVLSQTGATLHLPFVFCSDEEKVCVFYAFVSSKTDIFERSFFFKCSRAEKLTRKRKRICECVWF
jgi:hypothetical protein